MIRKLKIFLCIFFICNLFTQALATNYSDNKNNSNTSKQEDYKLTQDFVVIKSGNLKQEYIIKGQVLKKEENNYIPINGLLIYINGPKNQENSNTLLLATKTDKYGNYTFKVKLPGYYEIRIDKASAISLGLINWQPQVRTLLVK